MFRPTPFINDINDKGVTVGLTPAGTFTSDLDVPIRPKSFETGHPAVRGLPEHAGQQRRHRARAGVPQRHPGYMFMEAAQGDRRVERDAGAEADPVQRPDRDAVGDRHCSSS